MRAKVYFMDRNRKPIVIQNYLSSTFKHGDSVWGAYEADRGMVEYRFTAGEIDHILVEHDG